MCESESISKKGSQEPGYRVTLQEVEELLKISIRLQEWCGKIGASRECSQDGHKSTSTKCKRCLQLRAIILTLSAEISQFLDEEFKEDNKPS